MHRKHKYIKKEKRNGKWRYFYDYTLTGKGYERDYQESRKRLDNMLSSAVERYNEDIKDPNRAATAADRYYKTLDVYNEGIRKVVEKRYKQYDAIIPKAIDAVDDAISETIWTIEDIPHNIADKGRTITAKVLAGRASDYLVNDILYKTDAKEITARGYVYRPSSNGLTRMAIKEARLRQQLGDDLYDRVYND